MKITKTTKQVKKLVKKKKINLDDDSSHVACYSYPCCDLNPMGCSLLNNEPELIGHRD